ncbi:MAG: glycosyltransferase family 2 protein, partial [Candidatus Dadabacteria bacterium]
MDPKAAKNVLTVVIPAYNEEECIKEAVNSWINVINKIPSNTENNTKKGVLIVVNDGSKDKTGEILAQLQKEFGEERLLVINQENKGHGAAVVRGYKQALKLNPCWIFQTDSDNQFYPEDFWKLWEVRKDSPFILGIRGDRADAWYRKCISLCVMSLIRVFFGIWVKEANVPFRLIKAKYLKELINKIPQDAFAPNIFLSIEAGKEGKITYTVVR